MNRIVYVCFGTICFVSLNMSLYAQTDAAIKAAKNTVASESGSLKPFQKFSDVDDVHWLFGGEASLLFSATTFIDWVAGGEDQIGMNPIINIFYNYKKEKRTFENYATFAYGFLKTGKNKAIKSDDRLYYTSKIGYQMLSKVYYTATLLARTQFTPGYKTDTIRVSDFLAPAYLFISAGIDYRPTNSFSFVLSPVMGKATFVRSDDMNILAAAGMVTTEKDETGADIKVPHRSRYEFGGGVLISFKGNLLKDKISYNSQVDLFSNYMQKPENIDIYWTFQTKIMLYRNISADLRLDLTYDDDQKINYDDSLGGPKLQAKNFLGVGLFYQF